MKVSRTGKLIFAIQSKREFLVELSGSSILRHDLFAVLFLLFLLLLLVDIICHCCRCSFSY
jgi:hypothetical protein